MPLIEVKIIEGTFSQAQKRELIARLSDVMVSVAGDRLRPLTWVVIEEIKNGDWGMAGQPFLVPKRRSRERRREVASKTKRVRRSSPR